MRFGRSSMASFVYSCVACTIALMMFASFASAQSCANGSCSPATVISYMQSAIPETILLDGKTYTRCPDGVYRLPTDAKCGCYNRECSCATTGVCLDKPACPATKPPAFVAPPGYMDAVTKGLADDKPVLIFVGQETKSLDVLKGELKECCKDCCSITVSELYGYTAGDVIWMAPYKGIMAEAAVVKPQTTGIVNPNAIMQTKPKKKYMTGCDSGKCTPAYFPDATTATTCSSCGSTRTFSRFSSGGSCGAGGCK
jgi:hypothetical protein